ncbi:MAG: TRZ/ATZ family hydrolase [Gammaproteobacteria bacterium]|nr:TRZ/ATZ family hydrolase [Gammaproteobacteria bacterium]
MITTELLIHGEWVIPVEPDDRVLEHHAIAIDHGKITAILPSTEARERYQPQHEIHRPGHALIPGLINSHTHAAMSLMRGLADDLPLMSWLNDHIWPAEAEWVSPEFVRDGSDLAFAEMIRGGVTCFNDMYFFPMTVAEQAQKAGIRAVIGLIVIDFPTVWAKDSDEYLHKGLEVHDQLRHHPLITTAFAPHGPYTVSNPPLERIATLAEELDTQIHIHIHETAAEIAHGEKRYGNRPLARLESLGLISPRTIAVHMTHLNPEEIARFAELSGHVAHCPESNLKLASGFSPVVKLQAAGVNVALGSDGAASNNDLNLFGEMRSAALLAKGVSSDASAVSAYTALQMATICGARALAIEDQCGSLLPGKSADIVAVNLDTIETQPMYHPISQLVYACDRHQVMDVWVAGEQLLKQRHLTRMDESRILAQSRAWQQKLAANSYTQEP